ncbi:MAG: DUF4492 domain-containing protein [Flavobacteriales bacterium]
MAHGIKKAWLLYKDGFANMPKWGRTMWIIILIKGFIMFAVLKMFFFPNFLNNKFEDNESKSNYVIEQITNQE